MIAEASLLFALFVVLLLIRIPIAFALLGASIVLFFFNERLEAWTITQRLFFGVDSFVLLAIPLFILAANIMNASGITAKLIRLAQAMVGWIAGGLGMVNVAVSMLFAGVSGSSTADTAAVGGVLIPQMEKRGYAPNFSVGITAASSVIGTIIPPSIQMIIWASLTHTSVAAMFIGGVVPGLMIGIGLMAVCYVIARHQNYPREAAITFSETWSAFVDSVLALGVPVIVIGGIVGGVATPTEAAVLAVWYALILGLFVYRTIHIKDIPPLLINTVKLAALPLFALAAASVFSYLLAFYRVPLLIESWIGGVSPAWLLLAIVFIWLFIGTFLDAVPAMIITIPILAPSVQAAGIDPVHYGVVSVMALAVGLVTPPYGLCLLLAAKIGNVSVSEAFKGSAPFFLTIMIVIGLCALFPAFVTWLPGLALSFLGP